jgi:cell wall-associated NlpC family hydrolase
MVAWVFAQAGGPKVAGSAADIAQQGWSVPRDALVGGDLVFFNTLGRPYSHVGIYVGNGRFVHAPSSSGRVRFEQIDAPYWSARFDGGRRYFAPDAVARQP